jgi:hypothetical protein
MKLHFYIPEGHLPSKEVLSNWERGLLPVMNRGKSATSQSWIYQTWLELRDVSDARLTSSLPKDGIIITLSNFLETNFRATDGQYIATVAADYLPHPGAQLQIIQNAAHASRLPHSIFMPHWPQPGLIPRDPQRGNLLERISFFGNPINLAEELRSPAFLKRLEEELGVQLDLHWVDRWHDYSNVDAVLAVRDFSKARQLHKPATKLYNAWLAGVPLIAGVDSAFAAEGQHGLDYLVVHSANDCIRVLKLLRDNPSLRDAIVKSGQKKAASRARDAVREMWRKLCLVDLPVQMQQWERKSQLEKHLFWAAQKGLFFIDRKFRS